MTNKENKENECQNEQNERQVALTQGDAHAIALASFEWQLDADTSAYIESLSNRIVVMKQTIAQKVGWGRFSLIKSIIEYLDERLTESRLPFQGSRSDDYKAGFHEGYAEAIDDINAIRLLKAETKIERQKI